MAATKTNRYLVRFFPWLKDQAGFSIIENLMALAILTAVMIPACALMSKYIAMQPGITLVTATSLAQKTMEESIARHDYQQKTWKVAAGSRNWIIEQSVEWEMSLVHLIVRTRPEKASSWIYTLRTCRPRT